MQQSCKLHRACCWAYGRDYPAGSVPVRWLRIWSCVVRTTAVRLPCCALSGSIPSFARSLESVVEPRVLRKLKSRRMHHRPGGRCSLQPKHATPTQWSRGCNCGTPYGRESLASVRQATEASGLVAQGMQISKETRSLRLALPLKILGGKHGAPCQNREVRLRCRLRPGWSKKLGPSLKLGRFRSAAQYFSVAKSFDKEAGFEWEPRLDQAINQDVRSITRGIGPSSAKLDEHHLCRDCQQKAKALDPHRP